MDSVSSRNSAIPTSQQQQQLESSLTTPAIRYLELGDKTPPTSTDGIQRSNLDAFDINGYSNLLNFRAIQVGVGTHTLHVQYYK